MPASGFVLNQSLTVNGAWSQVRTREMDWTGLKLLLEGIEPKRVRLRYQHAQNHPTEQAP